jgi:type II secretory pathway pseudopilin PulG
MNPRTHRPPQGPRRPRSGAARAGAGGFTIVELLAAVAMVTVLATLVAALGLRTRERLRVIRAHNDLRQVALAIELYRGDHHGMHPPTRFSCSTGAVFPLPEELVEYGLPAGRSRHGAPVVALDDPFRTGSGYRYRSVGRAILNESTELADGGKLWVPDEFPRRLEGGGAYHSDPQTSPVLYAIWSMGPDPETPKFDVPGRLPVPANYWLRRPGEPGVVAHIQPREGGAVVTP